MVIAIYLQKDGQAEFVWAWVIYVKWVSAYELSSNNKNGDGVCGW